MAATSNPKSLQLWSERFDQFNAGRLTVQQFCLTVHCSVATFYYWKNKVEHMRRSASSKSNRRDEFGSADSTPSNDSAKLIEGSGRERAIQHDRSRRHASPIRHHRSNMRAMRRESSAKDLSRESAFVPVMVRGAGEVSAKEICVRLQDGTRVTVPADALEALEVVLQHVSGVAS